MKKREPAFITGYKYQLNIVLLVLFPVFLYSTSLFAERVDWDGGTDSIHTSAGGSVDAPENWGPAGGGADGAGGTIPTEESDVFLNDVQNETSVSRTVMVQSNQRWNSLTIEQTTEPDDGIIENRIWLAQDVVLELLGNEPLTTSGKPDAPVVIDLSEGSSIALMFASTHESVLADNTVLAGSGIVSNMGGNYTLSIDGTLAGPSIHVNNFYKTIFNLEENAVVVNPQKWELARGRYVTIPMLDNKIINPEQWENGVVTCTIKLGPAASFEASTSTLSPSVNSNYKFAKINLESGNQGQEHTLARFFNNYQNDGGEEGIKEAVYASAWDASGASDSSGGHFLIDLNGQDLYVDRFRNMTQFHRKSIQFVNTALDSTSSIRAVDVMGDTLHGGSFAVMNGSTLEFVGGSWFDTVYNRSVGKYPADSSAVPNSITGGNVDRTRRWDGAAANQHAAFNHYLGSGEDAAGNSHTRYTGTDGTLRIVGGSYTTSGFVLNPIGVNGLIDTTSDNPGYLDTTLDAITFRANSWQTITNIDLNAGFLLAPEHRYTAGEPVIISATPSSHGVPAGLVNARMYYVVNPEKDKFQLAESPNGTPIVPTNNGTGVYVYDVNELGNLTALPGLTVAGRTTINGHLVFPVIGGATAYGRGPNVCAPVFQPTLRVGGILPNPIPVIVDPDTNTFTLETGTVAEGAPVCFTATKMPVGLEMEQVYYARDVHGSGFRVAALPGEPAIDFTDAGNAVALVEPQASDEAELQVTGNLFVESRNIEGYIGGSSSRYSVKVASVTGDGEEVTVETNINHGLVPGDIISVSRGSEPFRGVFSVANVLTPKKFTYNCSAEGAGGTSLEISYAKDASINVAIQGNATVKVAGDVTIGGIGIPQNCLATGMGVGIHPQSKLIFNGGLTTTQTVAISPTAGGIYIGEDTTGANVQLEETLTAAGTVSLAVASTITGTDPDVGIHLVSGADMIFAEDALIDISGTFVLETDSVVDFSRGSIKAGSIDFAPGAVVDFKDREVEDGLFTVKGNAVAEITAAVEAGCFTSQRAKLGAWYIPGQDVTTVGVAKGTKLIIK
jgi:hypothetical protein